MFGCLSNVILPWGDLHAVEVLCGNTATCIPLLLSTVSPALGSVIFSSPISNTSPTSFLDTLCTLHISDDTAPISPQQKAFDSYFCTSDSSSSTPADSLSAPFSWPVC